MDELSFNIYVPSYKRSDVILTNDLLEYCTYVVRKSEEKKYREAGIENLLCVDDELINSGAKVVYWIAENAPEDVIAIIDDDIKDFLYRCDTNDKIGKNKEIITSEIERIAQLIVDLDIGFGFIDATSIPYNYVQEFGFKGVCGGIKWVYRKNFKAKLDEKVTYNFDCDIIMQELLHNRITLNPKYFCSIDVMKVNKGGEAVNRLRQDQLDSINNMKLKWGSHFKYNLKSDKPTIDVPR